MSLWSVAVMYVYCFMKNEETETYEVMQSHSLWIKVPEILYISHTVWTIQG